MRDRTWKVFKYVLPFTIAAGVLALYQEYVSLGGGSLLACTDAGGSCSKIFVKEFGYITIPIMSLTACLYLVFITWVNKLYNNDKNSNS